MEGHEGLFTQGDLLPVLNPKRKVVEKCLEHFKTDAEGYVVWQGIRLRTKNGLIKAATINNGNVGWSLNWTLKYFNHHVKKLN